MTLPYCFLLLAQSRASAAPKPGDWGFGWGSVAMVAAGAAGIVLIAWLIMRWLSLRERRIHNSPWQLFKDLSAAHGLSQRERQLLTRIAQQYRLDHPAALFVEAAWWEAERLGAPWQPRFAEIEKLRRRLFAVR
jgi:hypothetical protein